MEYTKRRNINRGYMKLEVWNDGILLFRLISNKINSLSNIDFKLKGQILDSAQSISANIAEGYCRKSINEYLYFLNVALGSLGELLTRLIGLKTIEILSNKEFEEFDKLHYEVENKLMSLIKALQKKRNEGTWDDEIHEPSINYFNNP
jgi:four helix bundle protein